MSTTPTATWPGPRLLVPMTVDALVLGQPNLNGQTFVGLQIPYAALSGQPSVTPPPFGPAPPGGPPSLGINLLWTLPYGLRSGHSQEDGSLSFPLLPNRWVILRSYVPATGPATPQLTAFVLESDFLGGPDTATSAYPDPDEPGTIVWIGRRYDIGGWTGVDVTAEPFLRAVGPGNVTFTATYQNLLNVFALQDRPSDSDLGAYTYLVAGWYSPIPVPDGQQWWSDPLLGVTPERPDGFATAEQWSDLLARFLWQVGDGSAGALAAAQADWRAWQQGHPAKPGDVPAIQLAYASQLLCHGGVWGIEWQGVGHLYPQQTAGKQVVAAVGNNPTEALGAWLGSVLPEPTPGEPTVERLIEAFQSGQISTFTDDEVAFESARHTAEFGRSNGGTVWTVVAPTQTDPAQSEGAANQSVPLDPTATAYLVRLNAEQAALDQQSRVLASQQAELYWLWYLLQSADDPKIQQGIDALQTALQETADAIATSRRLTDAAQADLVSYLASLPPPGNDWLVQPATNLRFGAPNDPVVLIAGAGLDDKLASPGAFDGGDSNLITRFTGQFVSGLEVAYGGSSAVVTAELVAAAVQLPTAPGPLPPEVSDLWLEALLLDPSAGLFLAGLFFQNAQPPLPPPTPDQLRAVAAILQKQQTLPLNAVQDLALDSAALAVAAGIQGTYPEALSFTAWEQPWTPLCMDWQVSWFPTSQTPAGALAGWQLGEIDWEWTGASISGTGVTYMGRTTLNARTALGLQQQIEQFIQTSPEYGQLPIAEQQELQEIVATLGQWDVITQALGDLGQRLLMRQPAITGPITPEGVAAAAGSVDRYAPLPRSPFFPIRSGHLLINRLWIVDVFGQRLSAAPDGQNVVPQIAEPLVTPGQPSYVQLPPRLTQPARLDFALLQADDDAIRTNSSDATSPVAGYLIPNYLDGSLAVFDAAGGSQGEVQPILLDSGAGLRWDLAPGTSAPLGAPPNVSNPGLNAHVLALVDALLRLGSQGTDALGGLLALMDGTQWLVDPQGQQEQGNLAALIGRPMAVVRASIALEPQGLPAWNESFAAARSYAASGSQTDGFTAVDFSVRIGDLGFAQNGVIGYFLDDDYTRLYAVYGYQPLPLGVHKALTRSGGRDALLRLAGGTPFAGGGTGGFVVLDGLIPLAADGTPRLLTLLLSPRGTIPAISGSLPSIQLTLPPGPTTAAFAAMQLTFRTGPLLTNPTQLRMPLPADIRGRWSWVQRLNVTTWTDDPSIQRDDAIARLAATATRLDEGWLQLSGAFASTSKRR